MCSMEMMPPIQGSGFYAERWSLPPVKDLLSGVQAQTLPDLPNRAATPTSLCSFCLSQDRTVHLRQGESCGYCYPGNRHSPPLHYMARRHSTAEALYSKQNPQPSLRRPSIPSGSVGPSLSTSPSLMGHYLSQPQSHQGTSSTTPHHGSSPLDSPPLPTNANSFSPIYLSHISTIPLNTTKLGPSPPATAKQASNDRHKIKEKIRRDGMGVYTQAAHLLRESIDAAALSQCPICASDPPLPSVPQSTPSADAEAASGTALTKAKIPRSDMQREGLLWDFLVALHTEPGQIAGALAKIREFAAQLQREKEKGMRIGSAEKRRKWESDVKAEKLLCVLRDMEERCERHGVDPWGEGGQGMGMGAGRKRKRSAEERLIMSMGGGSIPEGCSDGSASSAYGKLDSREGSEEDG